MALPVAGCRKTNQPATAGQATKRFPLRGKVIGINGATVTVAHEAIPGFMEAMTMPYKLKNPGIASELHPGDRITATLIVQQDDGGYHDAVLDDIVIVAQAQPDTRPTAQYHVPAPGDRVPDFRLVNQNGRAIHTSQFRGKVLLVTFIYTRCPLADYCPRMSRNFAEIDRALAADPAVYAKTHLLSISFDPAFDTPSVLRDYGEAYTGESGKDAFRHWDFAAPSAKDLAAITHYFGVGVTPGEDNTLTHSLSTVVIGKDGRILAWYPTNDWKPAELAAEVRRSARG